MKKLNEMMADWSFAEWIKSIMERLGQLSFYMTAVDKQIKGKVDVKTAGLLLCKSRNRVVVEYALSDLRKPMGVSTYNLGLPPLP